MPAVGRDLIDKRLGDRLPEKQGAKQREVIEDGAFLRGASLARLGNGLEVERRIGGVGRILGQGNLLERCHGFQVEEMAL